jgi:hypothetical protein
VAVAGASPSTNAATKPEATTAASSAGHSVRAVGTQLERDRLKCRLRRVAAALDELRLLGSKQQRKLGQPTRPIQLAIADFEHAAARLTARLRVLATDEQRLQPSRRSASPLTFEPTRRCGALTD